MELQTAKELQAQLNKLMAYTVSLGKKSNSKSEKSAQNTKSSEKQEASENGQNASFSSSWMFDSNVDVTAGGAVPLRAFTFTGGILLGSFFIFA